MAGGDAKQALLETYAKISSKKKYVWYMYDICMIDYDRLIDVINNLIVVEYNLI